MRALPLVALVVVCSVASPVWGAPGTVTDWRPLEEFIRTARIPEPPEFLRKYASARQKFDAREYANAIRELNEALNIQQPTGREVSTLAHPRAHFYVLCAHVALIEVTGANQHFWPAAMAELGSIVHVYPKLPALKLSLAEVYGGEDELARIQKAVDQAVLEQPNAIERRIVLAFLLFFSGRTEAARKEFDIVARSRPDLPALQPFRVHFAEQTPDTGLSRFEIAFIMFRLRIYDRSNTLFLGEVLARPADSRSYGWAALSAVAIDPERADQAHVLLRRLAAAGGIKFPLDPPMGEGFVDPDGKPDAARLATFADGVRAAIDAKPSPQRLALAAWLEFAAGNKRGGFARLDQAEAGGADPLAVAVRAAVGASPARPADGDGDALFKEERYEDAARAYFTEYDADPNNPAKGLALARAMLATGRFDHTAKLALAVLPDDQPRLAQIPAAVAGWRAYFADPSRLDGFLERFRTQCDDWPDRIDLYETYGIVLFLAGRGADARAVFETLRDEPKAGRSRAAFYLKRIAANEVPPGLAPAASPSPSPDDELAYVTVARARAAAYVLFGDRKYEDAERLLLKAVAKHAKAPDAWQLDLVLSHVQLARGQYERGEAFMRRALGAHPRVSTLPDDADASWAPRYRDELVGKEHIADLFASVKRRPADNKQRYLLACTYLLFRQYKEAGDEFERLRRLLEGAKEPVPSEVNALLAVARQKAKP